MRRAISAAAGSGVIRSRSGGLSAWGSNLGSRNVQKSTRLAAVVANGIRWHSSAPKPAADLADDDFFDSGPSTRSRNNRPRFFLPAKYRSRQKREQYVLGTQLGSGMFATVYQATCRETNRNVAVKVMNKQTTPKELCERELKIWSKSLRTRCTHASTLSMTCTRPTPSFALF